MPETYREAGGAVYVQQQPGGDWTLQPDVQSKAGGFYRRQTDGNWHLLQEQAEAQAPPAAPSLAATVKDAALSASPLGLGAKVLEQVPAIGPLVTSIVKPVQEGLYAGTVGSMKSAAGTVEAAGKVLGGTGSLGAALAPSKVTEAAIEPAPTLQDVWEGKGSAKDFLLKGVASNLPSMLATVGGGALAGTAGVGAVSYLLNTGDVYNDLRDKGIDAPGAALAAGVPISALDMIEPLRLLAKGRNMAVSKLVEEGLLKSLGKDFAMEAGTEGLQQTIQDATTVHEQGKQPGTGYDLRQLMWSTAHAAVLGGLTGGLAGATAHAGTGGPQSASYGTSGIESGPTPPTVEAPPGVLPSPVAGPFEPPVPVAPPTISEAVVPPTPTEPQVLPSLSGTIPIGQVFRAGKIEAGGAYFGLEGKSDLKRDDAVSYNLTGKQILDGSDPDAIPGFYQEVLKTPGLSDAVRERIEEQIDEDDTMLPATLVNEYGFKQTLQRLGYDGMTVWEPGDNVEPSSVFVWSTDNLVRDDNERQKAPTYQAGIQGKTPTYSSPAIAFEPIDVAAARESPIVAFGLDTADAGSLGASLATAVTQARQSPQARARISLAAAEAADRGFDGAEIAATAAEAAHQLMPELAPHEIAAAVQPFLSMVATDEERVQQAVETMRSVLDPTAKIKIEDVSNVQRRGNIDVENGAYFSKTGSFSTYGDQELQSAGDAKPYNLNGKKIIDGLDPASVQTVAREALKDPLLGPTEQHRLKALIADPEAILYYMDADELRMAEAGKRLGYDGFTVVENDDLPGNASSVFVWNLKKTKEELINKARGAKAEKLAALLFKNGISAEDVPNVPPEMWPQLAKLAGANAPGSPQTIALIAKLVRAKELGESSTLGANPVAGIIRSAARYMRRRQGLQRIVPAAIRRQNAIGSAFNRKMLTMRQLGWQASNFYPMQHRIKVVDAMNRQQNYVKIEGEKTLKLWQRLGEKQRVQLTTFAQKAHEESVKLGRRLTIAELDTLDRTLTPDQQATYHATDKYVQSVARSLDTALQKRVAQQGAGGNPSATGQQLSRVQNENFFPTVGFGPFLVHDLTTDQYYRTDTEAEQKGKRAALIAQGHTVGLHKLTREELSFASVPHRMIPDLLESLPLSDESKVKLKRLAYADVSGKASGYDAERAIAQFAQRMGNFLAKAYYRDDLNASTKMAGQVADQEAAAGQDATATVAMQDWLAQHAKDVLNPESHYQGLKSILFLHFFWGNVKQAAVNLTQIPLNTFPVLSAALSEAGVTRKFGKLEVGAANAVAAKLITKASYDAAHMFDVNYWKRFDQDKVIALMRLEQEGVLSQSYAPSIAALDHGSPIEEVMARAGLPRDKARAGAHYVRWMMEKGSAMFGLSEEYNRRVTALAAYDVGKELGVADPIDYAKQMVLRTQGDYSAANRPELFRGKNGLQLPYIFKAYQQNQLYLYRHVPGGVKGLLMLAAAVGLTGLPGADDILDLIDLAATKGRELAGYGNSKVSSRQWIREYLDAVVGGSEVLMNGLSRHMDSFADVSGSLSMGRVIPGVEPFTKGVLGSVDKTAAAMRIAEEFTGVAGSQGMNFLRASMDNSPDSHAFLRMILPEAVRQQKEAWDAMTNKEYRDAAGNRLVPVDPHDSWQQAELLAKMMGFQVPRVSRYREGKAEFAEWQRYYTTRRELMLGTIVAAIVNKGNDEMVQAKTAAFAKFNAEVPDEFKFKNKKEVEVALVSRLTKREREAAGFPTADKFLERWKQIQESFR